MTQGEMETALFWLAYGEVLIVLYIIFVVQLRQ